MYKILCVLALFMFESAWSYSNEKGPEQSEVFIQLVKGEKQFIELSEDTGFVVEWLETDEEVQDADESEIIQIRDIRPSGLFAAPTVLIQLADVRPSTPVLGPGQEQLAYNTEELYRLWEKKNQENKVNLTY